MKTKIEKLGLALKIERDHLTESFDYAEWVKVYKRINALEARMKEYQKLIKFEQFAISKIPSLNLNYVDGAYTDKQTAFLYAFYVKGSK